MPDLVMQQKLWPYDGSQDSTRHPMLISAKDIIESNNIIYTNYSTKRKRPGIRAAFTQKPGTSRRILGGIDYWRAGVQKIVYYDGSRIFAYNPLNQTQDDITGGLVIPVEESVCFIAFQGLLIICFGDGATPPKKWTGIGTISNLGSTAPNARYGRVFLNCLWLDDPSVPGRISKSRTGDPTLFTGGDAGTIDLDVNDGDPDGITAIMPPLDGRLYIGKRLGLWRVTPALVAGVIVYSQEKITDGFGCISHNAAVSAEYGLMFPSDRGVHFISSSTNISGISTDFITEAIQPDWIDDINFKRAKYCWATYDTEFNCYLFLYPRSSNNFPSDLKGYSIVAKKWFDWDNFAHAALFRYIDVLTKKKRTMFGSASGNFGYLTHDVKTDYGEAYDVFIRSGVIVPEVAPSTEFGLKAIAAAFVPQTAGTFHIAYKVNGVFMEDFEYDMVQSQDGGSVLGIDLFLASSVLGGSPKVVLDKRKTVGHGNFYEMFIYHSSTGSDEEDFELLGILTDINKVNDAHGRTVS